MIYSYGKFNNEKYKYFGGTPEYFINSKNLKKFTFSKEDYVSKIIIKNSENSFSENYWNKIIDTSNKEERFLAIKDYDDTIVCIPGIIFNIYETDIYEAGGVLKHNIYYKLDKRQQKYFGSIIFMIDNKNITINRDQVLLHTEESDDYFLEISDNFWKITFGKKFIKLFELSEFNMETKEVSLFMNKKNKIITETEINNEIRKEELNSKINSNYYIIILLLSFIAFMISITLVKNYHKNKKV